MNNTIGRNDGSHRSISLRLTRSWVCLLTYTCLLSLHSVFFCFLGALSSPWIKTGEVIFGSCYVGFAARVKLCSEADGEAAGLWLGLLTHPARVSHTLLSGPFSLGWSSTFSNCPSPHFAYDSLAVGQMKGRLIPRKTRAAIRVRPSSSVSGGRVQMSGQTFSLPFPFTLIVGTLNCK